MLRWLRQRRREPEVLDQPWLDAEHRVAALRGLARLNALSRSSDILWKPIRALARRTGSAHLSVLDLGAGGGDVAIRLCHRAKRRGLNLHVTGYDFSPVTVEHAQRRATRQGASATFAVRDVFNEPIDGSFDVVMSSLFLHHQDEPQAVELLRRMAKSARKLVLVNDLLRSTACYAAVKLACRLVSCSKVVHHDGPRSVEAAFRIDEVRRLCEQAGLHGARIGRAWPFRFLLSWEPSVDAIA
ncbi:MAG TPA: methyltransferase domain-containing protein [Pirellulales bacterium]|nr:methyltransferase domain-containing protein [Pirellulales bacterium]